MSEIQIVSALSSTFLSSEPGHGLNSPKPVRISGFGDPVSADCEGDIMHETRPQSLESKCPGCGMKPSDARMLSGWINILGADPQGLMGRQVQEQKMEAIGAMVIGIARDLSDFLTPILGFSEMLMEDLPQGRPEHAMASEIFKAARRAANLMKQIVIDRPQDGVSANAHPDSAQQGPSSSAGGERILIVDDDESFLCLQTQMLKHFGHQVTAHPGSIAALDAFRADPWSYDLVIADLHMPAMCGERFARELIAIRPDIPILICTGDGEKSDEQWAHDLGVRGGLLKPVLARELCERIRCVMKRPQNA